MRKLIVSNILSLDGYYEGKNKSLAALFDYFHKDYVGDQSLDLYQLQRLRAADTLLLGGRESFIGNKNYWRSVPDDPKASAVRLEIAALQSQIEKIVVSDQITPAELSPWDNTRIVNRSDAPAAITKLKRQPGKDILVFTGRLLWNDITAARIGGRVAPDDLPSDRGRGHAAVRGTPTGRAETAAHANMGRVGQYSGVLRAEPATDARAVKSQMLEVLRDTAQS